MVEEYDPVTDIWTTKASMPIVNGYFGTGVVNGIIYTMGGADDPNFPYKIVSAYDPLADEWSNKTAMPTARFALGAAVVNGKIYAIGGSPNWPPSSLSVVEEYTPPITSVENKAIKSPASFMLHQNYPNPFNPSTTIIFDLPKASEATLKIFNIIGEEMATLVSDRLSAGSYSYEWDAHNLPSGVYLYRLEAEGFIQTKKMILIR
jgi:hypothetical protein